MSPGSLSPHRSPAHSGRWDGEWGNLLFPEVACLHSFCLKELQGWKWRGKEGPATDPQWDPAQRELLRSDTITEAMDCS